MAIRCTLGGRYASSTSVCGSRSHGGFQIIDPTGPHLEVLRQIERTFGRRGNHSRGDSLGPSLLDEHVDGVATLVEDVHQGEVKARKPGTLVELLPCDEY